MGIKDHVKINENADKTVKIAHRIASLYIYINIL